VIGAVDTKLTWYVTRSSGLVAWAVVTASIVWGLTLSTRLVRRRGVPAWLLDLHKFLGTLSLVFTGVHLLALWADSYVRFGAREMFVPMAAQWRPGPVAWGIVAAYMLVAVETTSWVLRRLPRRLWHGVHLTSLVMFGAVTVHAFAAGTDAANLAVQWAALTTGLLVCFLVVFRALAPRRAARGLGSAASAKEGAWNSASSAPGSGAPVRTRSSSRSSSSSARPVTT
jgi:predicted ferric reductase